MTDYNDVISVKTPNKTRSYQPVSNKEMIELLRDQVGIFLPEFTLKKERFWLSSDSQRMMAKLMLTSEVQKDEPPLCVVIKNSYDKSTATAIGTGVGLDNDKIWMRNRDITLFRKHTKYVMPSLSANIAKSLDTAAHRYQELLLLSKLLREVPCEDAHAFALFGIARGYGMIGVRAMSDAYKKWNSGDGGPNGKTLWDVSESILAYVEDRGDPASMMEDAGSLGSVVEMLPDIFNIKREANNES
jgi:hypothetical protein